MSKDLNVNLRIDADVQQAKAQIQDLQNTLKQVAAASSLSPNTFDTKKIKEGVQAAKELQTHLRAATDVNTGKLNLSAFSASLKTSGKSLAQYKTQLEALGPAGEDAFLKVSRSIATANAPLRKTNQYLTEFATTLKNTARWQISSSILHGFMGSVQSAYRYAKDLNESLTDIRIVTGQNADQMAEFAEKANKAAKALSATTNQYAKASLIYYQQGLDDQEVQDRADITIKMAHASGQSAEIVSDQLTAVWNNFAKGGENLEHYADVMTALGAATASSSDEIAGGLEKFASIADMIGLSYEYAASALATITATTRQSEDVVGTALKTIFARIQGLKLGDTLDDGTDLNKYSEALQKIGISIFEQNGELKNMDNILYEMGAKWETLSKDQQVALAQTVAGVRQYNQLVSLMDGWDIMLENVALSLNSDGTLNEQAEIYAESWEGASNRVRAAAEGIYQSLLDDDFFIALTNGFATLLEGVDGFVEGLGGMEGVLSMLGAFITQKLAKEAPVALNTIKQNLMQITGQAHQIATQTQSENLNFLASEGESARKNFMKSEGTSAAYAAEVTGLETIGRLKQQLIQYSDQYNAVEKANAESEIAYAEQMTEMLVRVGREFDNLKAKNDIKLDKVFQIDSHVFDDLVKLRTLYGQLSNIDNVKTTFESLKKQFNNGKISAEEYKQGLLNLSKQVGNLPGIGKKVKNSFQNLTADIKKFGVESVNGTNRIEQTQQALSSSYENTKKSVNNTTDAINRQTQDNKELKKEVDAMLPSLKLQAEMEEKIKRGYEGMAELRDRAFEPPKVTVSQFLTQTASAAMQLNAVLSSMTTLEEVFSNEDSTTLQKFTALLGTLTSVMFLVNTLTQVSTNLQALETGARGKNILSIIQDTQAKIANKIATEALSASQKSLIATMGMFAVAAIALAGIVWAVTEAYEAWKNSTPEAQLEKIQEEAKKAADSFQEAKNAYEDMMNTINKYKDQKNALQGLAEDSEEYRQGLLEANEAALQLIDTLNLQQGENLDYTINDKGLIEINEERLNEKMEENNDRVQHRQARALYTRSLADNQKAKVEKINFAKDLQSEERAGRVDIASSQASEEELKAIDILVEEYRKQGNAIFEETEMMKVLNSDTANISENVINALSDNDEETKKLVEAIASNKEALEENTAAIVGDSNAGNEEFEGLSDRGKTIAQGLIAKKVTNDEFTEEEKAQARAESIEILEDPEKLAEAVTEIYGLDPDNVKVWKEGNKIKVAAKNKETGGFDTENADTIDWADFQPEVINNELAQYSENSNVGKRVQMAEGMKASDYGVSDEDFNTILEDVFVDQDLTSLYLLPSQEEVDKFINYINEKGQGILGEGTLIGNFEFSQEEHDKQVEQAQERQASSIIATGAETYGLDAEILEIQAEQLQKVYEAEELTKVQAAKLAVENQRMNKGVEELSENWEDWNKELNSGIKGTPAHAKAVKNLTKVIADLTGAAEDLELPNEFFENEKNLKLIEKAAKGSEQAIAELGVAVGKTSVEMMEMKDGAEVVSGTMPDGSAYEITLADFNTSKQIVLDGLTELQEKVASGEDLVGKSLDQILSAGAEGSAEWVAALNEMAMATGMSVQEMNSLLASMNLEANVKTTYIDQEVEVPEYEVTQIPTGKYSYKTTTNLIGTKKMMGKVAVAQIATDGSDPGSPVNYIENGSVSPSSVSTNKGGGGGGSKSNPAEEVDFTEIDEVIDRYKEIDDTLSDIEDTMSDINKQADRLYGASRISQMEKEKKLLLQQADALKTKKLQAENYMNRTSEIESQKGDRQKLVEIGAKYGITWEFDTEDGDILNYTSAMEGLYNELHAAEVKMDGMATKEAQDEFKKDTVSKIEEKIEKVKDALSKYEDTKELIKDLDNQLQEAIWAWQDKNFEVLEYKLELKLDIEDQDLQYLDYLMNKWSDDFFKLAESAALMYNSKGYDQVEGYGNQLANFREHEQELQEQYKNKEISQAKYIEGLKNVRDGYYENLEALNELDKTMMHFYEDSLAAGAEELGDYTDHMEHLTGVFDHYLNLMDILGKSKDYEAMGDFLEGRAETLEDQLKVSKDYYEILVEDKAKIEKELNNALRSGSEEDKKYWKEQWDAIVDAVDEAQDQMLSLTEEWASAMKEVIQNNMTKLAEKLEKALTGGIGFEFLMDEFDKLNTRQEEYLTKTNQIYETNKLIRQASQKIDQTDNKVAKQKMQNFVEETKSLQQNNQLSEYELEIQQAKYELLLAEIALEEAQNAKSTVRMQRDSEGNFGYVYTADQDAVDDAEQGLDDAKNRLYNISLEGQQEYTEKYLQAQQSMFDELAELQQMFLDGEITTQEEYERRKEAIVQHYYGEGGVLWTYSKLYNVAVQTDAAATADYWGKEYGEMTQHTEDWQIAVNDYLEQVEDETEDWADVSEKANRVVEGALKDSKTATKDLTDESGNLSKKIRNDLLPAMEKEYERIIKNTKEYGKERDAILEMIAAYEKYLELTNQEIKDESNKALNSDDHFKKDYSLSALINAAEGDMDAAYKDIDKRNEKIKDDGNYSDKTSSTTKKKVDAVDKLSDSQKEAIASSLKYLEEQGKYTTEQVDIILKQNGASFDTGGFTGVWGPEGKLAFLHQKELVLNEHDTDNMLNTVSMIRELVSMIDAGAAGSMISGLLSTPGFTNMLNHDFQQNVEIYAEFPDATDHSEIEQAFNNLLNTASQYANRKI